MWRYKRAGDPDNAVGIPGTGATHGSEEPSSSRGGGPARRSSARPTVAAEQQSLTEAVNDWLVARIKNPRAGPRLAEDRARGRAQRPAGDI